MPTMQFDELLTSNAEFLKPFASSLTHDSEAARDLYQETMYRALANQDKYNRGTNISAWLHTIMKNIFINNYRRKKKQRTIFDHTVNDYLLDYNQPAESSKADGNLRVKEIYRVIDQLPVIFKSPFLLYFEGYKYHEIADRLHEPLGTIKSRIHFARKMLKSRVPRYD